MSVDLPPVQPTLHDVEQGLPFEVFVVHRDADERDSGIPDPSKVFTDKAAAKEAAEGAGWYGGTAHVSRFWAIRDTADAYWLLGNQIEDINLTRAKYERGVRAKALQKLSAEEKRVLGIR